MNDPLVERVARIIHKAGVHGRCHVSWERLRDDEQLSRIETAALVLAAITDSTLYKRVVHCPACNGEGLWFRPLAGGTVPCDICNGTGAVEADQSGSSGSPDA